MKKRGLSTVVTSLILILLVLVAVGVVWVVVANIISEGSEQVALGKFTIDLEIKSVSIDETSNNVSLVVKRNPGKGEFSGIKFLFYNETDMEEHQRYVSLKELESKRFDFHLNNLNVSTLTEISIALIFETDSGKESIGNIIDTYEKGGDTFGEVENGACVPTTCAILGYECGIWANGTCAGNIDCEDCDLNYDCIDGVCELNETGSYEELLNLSSASCDAGDTYLTNTCDKAFDGDTSTGWIASHGGTEWIWVDLGSIVNITKISMWSVYDAAYSSNIQNNTITISTDNVTWSTFIDGADCSFLNCENDAVDQWNDCLPMNRTARYVKFSIWESFHWVQEREIRVYSNS